MKKVLIISPYFPPTNTADMQRIRMSLPYFKKYGWTAEVVTVDPVFSDLIKDPYLAESIPGDITVHYVSAFKKNWTSKIGFGNIAYRSVWFYKKQVDGLLGDRKFDLIYFSTTQFPVCVLGGYWKKKWGIPYVIDIQDMWHSDYYKSKPRSEQPPKYLLSYRVNKYLEKIAMRQAGGLIYVSQKYQDILAERYPHLQSIPHRTLTFGVSDTDFSITRNHSEISPAFKVDDSCVHLVFTGRGGHDIADSLKLLFTAFKKLLEKNPDAEKLRFHFIGTSYAPAGTGEYTVLPVAKSLDVVNYVHEQPDRIGFYESIASLLAADAIFIAGSNDPNYTASKIFQYIQAEKPFFALFNSQSSAVRILKECCGIDALTIDSSFSETTERLENILTDILYQRSVKPIINNEIFRQYSADTLTEKQTQLFDLILSGK